MLHKNDKLPIYIIVELSKTKSAYPKMIYALVEKNIFIYYTPKNTAVITLIKIYYIFYPFDIVCIASYYICINKFIEVKKND